MFDCMEHLPIHLADEARLGGPVQYRWMYPFERFINHLKSKMKNKRYVEGSICDAYLIEETTYFTSFYFEDHVVQWAQKVKDIWTPKSDSQLINIYYLTVKMFNQFYGLRQYNPGATTEDIDQEVERSFASWFRDYVYNPANNVCNQALIDLACGSLMQATTYNGYNQEEPSIKMGGVAAMGMGIHKGMQLMADLNNAVTGEWSTIK
nr:uncharacterized protein LOC109190933 [Ipomoea batatas]